MRFDMSPSGLDATSARATEQMDGLDTDVRMLVAAIAQAGVASGGGPIDTALARFSGDVQQRSASLISRVMDTIRGAHEVNRAHEDGDQEMAGNAGRAQAEADFSVVERGTGGSGG